MRAIVIVSLLSIFAVSSVVADDHGAPGPDDHVVVLATVTLEGSVYYVVEDHGATYLFEETNGVHAHGVPDRFTGAATGLQPAPFCLTEDGIAYVHPGEACVAGVRVDADLQLTNGVILAEVEHVLHEVEERLPGHEHEA